MGFSQIWEAGALMLQVKSEVRMGFALGSESKKRPREGGYVMILRLFLVPKERCLPNRICFSFK